MIHGDTAAEIVQHKIPFTAYSWTVCEQKEKKRKRRKVTFIREIIDGKLLPQLCLFPMFR